MLRVKTEALSLEDGNHYLEKNLFTGIAISLKDCIVDRLTEFSQGRIIGEYKNSYLPAHTFQLRVDYSCLMQEYNDVEEPYYYKKKDFRESLMNLKVSIA